jgi:hypothetical protein
MLLLLLDFCVKIEHCWNLALTLPLSLRNQKKYHLQSELIINITSGFNYIVLTHSVTPAIEVRT